MTNPFHMARRQDVSTDGGITRETVAIVLGGQAVNRYAPGDWRCTCGKGAGHSVGDARFHLAQHVGH